MANVYVYSGATGGATGADWANAYTTLAAACTAKLAGDTFFVAHDHAETSAATITITSPGTEANPCRIYCVNRAGSVPPVSADLRTTATITTTGVTLTVSQTIAECYGIIFSAGATTSNSLINIGSAGQRSQRMVNCAFKMVGTGASSKVTVPSSAIGIWENCTVQCAAVGQGVGATGTLIWRHTATPIVGAIIPTNLFTINNTTTLFLEGVDLSAMGSGKTIVGVPANNSGTPIILKDCKLGASVTICATPITTFGTDVTLIRCDSGDTNYRTEKYSFAGTLTTEITIVRTGGASDGTTPIAWKIVTTANSRWEFPFECLPITLWNETIGSAVTVTIQGIWGTGTVPNNDDIWIDVEYFGTSGFPLASKAVGSKANGLASGTALSAGSGTWGGSTTSFAMSVTFTPQEKGPLTIYVRAAKASSTFYVDPKPVIT